MLEVLLGLRRDISHSSFPLEFNDELSGCAHPVTIGQSAAVEEGMPSKPQLHRVALTRPMTGPALRRGRCVIARHRALATKMVAT